MKVLKFGGGCLKDAEAIKKLPNILKKYENNIIVVISAFGKLTNLLEDISSKRIVDFSRLHVVFTNIMKGLSFDKKNILKILNLIKPLDNSNAAILAIGELISSQILSYYLHKHLISHTLCNATGIIKTSNKGISASVDWEETNHRLEGIKDKIAKDNNSIVLTQGFIASYSRGKECEISCLGREGSDYSAAILGNIFNVEEVVLFKDVDGIYSSDPKKNKQAKLFHTLSYNQAFDLCNNGNTVVHPKTIKPLKEKKIPLVIKNFNNIDLPGTVIS